MKQGWEIKKLGEVSEIKPPKKLAKEKLSDEDAVTFLPMADLKEFNNIISPIQIKQLKDVYKAYTYFENNDVLLAKITPCFENGKLGVAKNLQNGVGFGSSEYIVLRPNEGISAEYIYYFLSLDYIRKDGKKKMTGAVGHKRISVEYISNQNILIPPLNEQKRIVAILAKAFDAIEKAKANAEKNLKNAKELFESYLQSVFENKGNGWVETNIGEACTLQTGGTPKTNKQEYYEGGKIKWLVSGDINKKTIYDCEGRITELGLANSNAKYLPINSVLIALNGQGKTRGAVAMLRTKATCNQSLVSIYPKDEKALLPELVFSNLEGRYEEIRRITGDSGNDRRGLNMPLIRNIKFSYPKKIIEQKEIIQKLDVLSIETKKLENIYLNKIEDLEELKKSILQKAFEGEL